MVLVKIFLFLPLYAAGLLQISPSCLMTASTQGRQVVLHIFFGVSCAHRGLAGRRSRRLEQRGGKTQGKLVGRHMAVKQGVGIPSQYTI